MRTPQIEPLYRAAVIARWCDVSCSMLQTLFLMNHYTSVVPHVRTCFLNVHTLQIERYIGRVILSATLGTDLVVFPHGVRPAYVMEVSVQAQLSSLGPFTEMIPGPDSQ